MTPTDELRRMLDERGVEWWPDTYYKETNTCWNASGMEWRASQQKDGKLLIGCTSLEHLTPAQAVAATAGEPHEGYVPETKYQMVMDELRETRKLSDAWQTVAKIRKGKCQSLKETNADLCRMLKERDAATVAAGTCEMRDAEGSFCSVNRPVYICECGAFCTDYSDATTYFKPRYCPNCGRRVERGDA